MSNLTAATIDQWSVEVAHRIRIEDRVPRCPHKIEDRFLRQEKRRNGNVYYSLTGCLAMLALLFPA